MHIRHEAGGWEVKVVEVTTFAFNNWCNINLRHDLECDVLQFLYSTIIFRLLITFILFLEVSALSLDKSPTLLPSYHNKAQKARSMIGSWELRIKYLKWLAKVFNIHIYMDILQHAYYITSGIWCFKQTRGNPWSPLFTWQIIIILPLFSSEYHARDLYSWWYVAFMSPDNPTKPSTFAFGSRCAALWPIWWSRWLLTTSNGRNRPYSSLIGSKLSSSLVGGDHLKFGVE